MVIKSKIYDFLKKNLGEYLYGFQKNQLDVGLLSGHIDLVNVNFRPDKVNQLLGSLGLPITIKAGLMGKLRLKCHYTSFLSSPIEVEIDELLLVFGPINHLAREEKMFLEDETDKELWHVEMEQEIERPPQGNHYSTGSRRKSSHDVEESSGRPHNGSSHTKVRKNQPLSEAMQETPVKRSGSRVIEQPDVNLSGSVAAGGEGQKKKSHRRNGDRPPNGDTRKATDTEQSGGKIVIESKRPPSRKEFVMSGQGDENYMQPEKKKEGLLEKYFSKVLKNLILTIKGVHVRYEDETYPYLNPFSIGISLSKLEVKNVNQEFVYKDLKTTKRAPRKNSIVKEVNLTNFAMYIYSMASVLIPTSLWEATIHSEIGIFEAFPAYEVRDLIIQESQALSKKHPSTFIEPTNVNLCVTFNDEAPTLRIAGIVDRASVKFTAAMSECVRNFFDYCTNVQIWPLIMRFRPFARIPERPAKREHRKERKKRREIVRLWFQYAFAFVKTKRAAIKYVKDRKKDNELFKQLEKQEKIREKVSIGTNNLQKNKGKPQLDLSAASTDTSKKSIFDSFRPKNPLASATKLNDLAKGNKKSTTISRRPYDGDTYFPKSLANSEIEITVNSAKLSILDEDTKLSLDIEIMDLSLVTNTLLDEMNSLFTIGGFVVSMLDQNKSMEVVRSGRKKSAFEQKMPVEPVAVRVSKIYRPGEVLIPNDIYLSMNMYEIFSQFSALQINYNHNAMNHFFLIKEAIELDKCFRENLDIRYVKAFKKHCKKNKMPKIFGVDFKKFILCKQVANKLVDMQKEIEIHVQNWHTSIAHILFDLQFELEGGTVSLSDFSPSSLLTISLPKSKIAVSKDKDNMSLSALGFKIQSSSTPIALYEFITTISGIAMEKIKLINTYNSYRKPKLD